MQAKSCSPLPTNKQKEVAMDCKNCRRNKDGTCKLPKNKDCKEFIQYFEDWHEPHFKGSKKINFGGKPWKKLSKFV